MATLIVVEVLEKSGKVHERLKFSALPIVLGRAYDADVILADDFVSPHHARIEQDAQGQLVLTDLQSENGIYLMPALRAQTSLVLQDDTLVRLGQSLLRLRRPQLVLPPTHKDTLLRSRVARQIGRGTSLMGLAAIGLSLIALDIYQSTPQQLKTGKWLLEIVEVAMIVPIWAGIWAILSRVFAHHMAFVGHAVIACLGLLGFFLVDTAIAYYAFGFSALVSAEALLYVCFGLVAGTMLYGHLRFATLLTPRQAGTTALASAGGMLALAVLALYVQNVDFDDTLRYASELKPAAFRISKEKSSAEFIQAAHVLEKRLPE